MHGHSPYRLHGFTQSAGGSTEASGQADWGAAVSTWGQEHRLDVGGVEEADDRAPGPHPPAAHSPIGACQALGVQETFL